MKAPKILLGMGLAIMVLVLFAEILPVASFALSGEKLTDFYFSPEIRITPQEISVASGYLFSHNGNEVAGGIYYFFYLQKDYLNYGWLYSTSIGGCHTDVYSNPPHKASGCWR